MKKILLVFSLFIFAYAQAQALDVVKPQAEETTVQANSTYVYGTVSDGSTLKINSQDVKICGKNIFVHVIPLSTGNNKITMVETHKDKSTETKIFNINRTKITPGKPKPYIPKKAGTVVYAKTIKNYVPVRVKPDDTAEREADLPEGIVLYFAGRQGDYYKIEETGGNEFWVNKNFVSKPVITSKRIPIEIGKPVKSDDNLYNYTKFRIKYPVLYTIKQKDNKLAVTLYGVYGGPEAKKRNLEYVYESANTITGYDGIYTQGCFELKTAKIPEIKSKDKPLEGIRIFIDAGHGGKETGAVGPARIPEKQINLQIALKLIDKLKNNEGAVVSYSRTDDTQVDLYKRVDLAKENNAFISLSIHNNALPEGDDPFVKHGTGTYYYNQNAYNLALRIKDNLVNDMALRDDNANFKSLVLNRATNPVSTLIEVAYMIYPEEYIKLQDEKFQNKAADSIIKSLKEYVLSLQADNAEIQKDTAPQAKNGLCPKQNPNQKSKPKQKLNSYK